MKIKRFDESYNYEYDEMIKTKNISQKNYDYITDFCANSDYNVIEWISKNSKSTKLKDFINITKSEKNALIFSESKNFKKLKEYIETNNQIGDLNKEYNRIIKKRNILYTEASNEIMYTFQQELINIDFDNFYKLFIEDSYEDSISGNIDDGYIYYDVHPDIMIEYGEKILNYVDVLINSKKYNL